jgi:hypothetical protein
LEMRPEIQPTCNHPDTASVLQVPANNSNFNMPLGLANDIILGLSSIGHWFGRVRP